MINDIFAIDIYDIRRQADPACYGDRDTAGGARRRRGQRVGPILSTRIAITRASKTLEEAVVQAQPVIDRIAELLAADVARLRPILRNAHYDIVGTINGEYDVDLDFRRGLRAKRLTAYETAFREGGKFGELAALEQAVATNDGRLKERAVEIDKATVAYRAKEELLSALIVTTAAWAKGHRELAVAIKEKRTLSVDELQCDVCELRELVKKVRAL